MKIGLVYFVNVIDVIMYLSSFYVYGFLGIGD